MIRISAILMLLSIFLTGPLAAQETELEPYQPHKKKDYLVTISTELGDIVMILYDETPLHKANFLRLVEEGYFDGIAFHRVMKGFMVQGGDPNTKEGGDPSQVGNGGPGYTVPAEFSPELTHQKGALAAARQPDNINPLKASSGSQFYLVHNPAACRHLNMNYTVFGQVISGIEVIDKIANQPVRGTRPIEDITMTITAKRMSKKKIAKLYDVE